LNISKIEEQVIMETSYDKSIFQSSSTINTEYQRMMEQEASTQLNSLLKSTTQVMESTNRASFDIVEKEA